jgi:hypothetical protein
MGSWVTSFEPSATASSQTHWACQIVTAAAPPVYDARIWQLGPAQQLIVFLPADEQKAQNIDQLRRPPTGRLRAIP